MSSRSLTLLIVATVAVVSATLLLLLHRQRLRDDSGPTILSADVADVTLRASASETHGSEDGDRAASVPVIGDSPDDVAADSLFGRASPAEIERAVYQRISEQPGLRLTSLTSVECDTLKCRIVFSGVDANPQYVDNYNELLGAFGKPPWNEFRLTSGSLGTREISPGAREFVMEFTYVALVDLNGDPRIAAQQQAACAGAWARVTELRGSEDYIRHAREEAEKQLALAAETLGLEEAQRLADSLQFGPLTRECLAMPY